MPGNNTVGFTCGLWEESFQMNVDIVVITLEEAIGKVGILECQQLVAIFPLLLWLLKS